MQTLEIAQTKKPVYVATQTGLGTTGLSAVVIIT